MLLLGTGVRHPWCAATNPVPWSPGKLWVLPGWPWAVTAQLLLGLSPGAIPSQGRAVPTGRRSPGLSPGGVEAGLDSPSAGARGSAQRGTALRGVVGGLLVGQRGSARGTLVSSSAPQGGGRGP